jgi:phosphatidylinositol alpha 1,6-mannosyltransferase
MQPSGPPGPPLRGLHIRTPSHGYEGLSQLGSSPSFGALGLPSSVSSNTLIQLGRGSLELGTPVHSRSSSFGAGGDGQTCGGGRGGRGTRPGGPAAAVASRFRKSLELALGCALVAWLLVIFITSHGRFDVSTTRRPPVTQAASAKPPTWSAPPPGAPHCPATGAPPPGRFLLPRAAYSPGRVSSSGGRSRVFVLTAVSAGDPHSTQRLETWLDHYASLGVAPQHMLVLAQVGGTSGEATQGVAAGSALDELAAAADAAGAFVDVWVGELPPFSIVAARWAALLGRYSRKGDWVLVADVDELLEMPHGQSLPSAAASAAALGYKYMLAHRIEVSLSGGVAADGANASSLSRCTLPRNAKAATAAVGATGGASTSGCVAIPPRGPVVIAARGVNRMAGSIRPLLDVGIDDRVGGRAPPSGWLTPALPRDAYPVHFPLRHTAWGPGAETRAQLRAAALSACFGPESAPALEAAKAAEHLASSHGWVTSATCHVLRCQQEGAPREAAGGAHDLPAASTAPERRIAIVTSVWDHVDGVSKTLRTVSSHLLSRRDDTSLMLLTPDVANGGLTSGPLRTAAARAANVHPGLVVVPIPSLPAPGRPDYRWAPPLPSRAASELALFAPDAVHVAAPDFLGHSAVAWARAHGVCALCTHHTAFPSYLQYYGAGMAEPVVEAFMARFYRRCDYVAVPSYAAADALAHAGVPRSKLGFFPRGVNATLYRPQARSDVWRADVAGVKEPGDRVVLWVARVVREKGLDMFVAALDELWRRRQKAVATHGGKAQANAAALAAAGADAAAGDEVRPFPPSFRVVIAGTGPDLAWLQARIPAWPPLSDSGSSGTDDGVSADESEDSMPVRYVGHASGTQLATALASSDVFYFPSKTEVFPNNVAEAMASGLAICTEDVPSMAALLEHNATGWLIHLSDDTEEQTKRRTRMAANIASAHADALARLLSNDPLRARLGAAAAAATHGLTWRRAVDALVRGYDACAARKRAEREAGATPKGVRRAGPGDDGEGVGFSGDDFILLNSGLAPDALLFRVGANLTGRYVFAPGPPPREQGGGNETAPA